MCPDAKGAERPPRRPTTRRSIRTPENDRREQDPLAWVYRGEEVRSAGATPNHIDHERHGSTAVAAALVSNVDQQPPTRSNATEPLIAGRHIVGQHHEPDRLLTGIDRPEPGMASGDRSASSSEAATESTDCSWPGATLRARTAA
jgi:hypothetical protein